MHNKWIALISCWLVAVVFAYGQHDAAFQLYDKRGKKVAYQKMINTLTESDVVLFGELHDNPIAHWMQLKVTKSIHEHRGIVLGAEMFETDNQAPLNNTWRENLIKTDLIHWLACGAIMQRIMLLLLITQNKKEFDLLRVMFRENMPALSTRAGLKR